MFIIRADGNAKTGAGHLMRCLTIADALKDVMEGTSAVADSGEAGTGGADTAAAADNRREILFVCADEDSARLVERYGFAVTVLHTDYRYMEQELPAWETLMAQKSGRGQLQGAVQTGLEKCIILIDSYYVTDAYLEKIRTYGRTVLLDDMQERPYPVDAVVNYNAFAEEEIYRTLYQGTGTAFYLGSRYVPVRRQFLNRTYKVAEKVENVLITTGGGDVENIAGRILEALEDECGKKREMEKGRIHYHAVIGKFNPHLEKFRLLVKESPWVHLYHDVQDMAALMEKCDLAITAGGTTIYELAAIGVPFVCFSYAENQERLTRYIGTEGIAGFAGAYHVNPGKTLTGIQRIFSDLCRNVEKRIQYCSMERNMIDGQGARRLAEGIFLGRKS